MVEPMKIIKLLLVNNDCFKLGRKIVLLKGLMIHSVGCSQPKAMPFINQWNKPGVQKAVHGFIEATGDVYQTLPYMYRGWHGGGTSNNNYLGFEMTEPSTIKYIGGATFNDSDPVKTKAHVLATYKTAVELFAQLCKEFKLDPLAGGVIISHSEGCKMGIASAHSDVEHLWSQFGLTMAQFRLDIKALMTASSVVATPLVTEPKVEPSQVPGREPESIESIVARVKKRGIVGDAMYWIECLSGERAPEATHLQTLFKNILKEG